MNEIDRLRKNVFENLQEIEDLKEQVEYQDLWREEYLSRIEKAIEYIKEKYEYLLGDDTFLAHDEIIDRKQINHILEILKGSDKE